MFSLFCLLDWQIQTPHVLLVSEGKFSIISLKTIISPRKEIKEYKQGEMIQARWSKSVYYAVILEISGKFTFSSFHN